MHAIPRVAIACQGGGSHAAFGAGLLSALLSPAHRERFRLLALSGTSGGAISAALVWRGLLASGPEEASERLRCFWRELAAKDPVDALATLADTWLGRVPGVADVAPFFTQPLVEARLRSALRAHLELETLTADAARRAALQLFVGATDVRSGDRVVFHGDGLTYEQLLASAAVPPQFRAIETDGCLCWDGLFSANPPLRELTNLPERPDELWVVQISPQRRAQEPRNMREIKNRTNELSGNVCLGQELYFIDKLNQLLTKHESLRTHYASIALRVVDLPGESLDQSSKLDRSAPLIERLLALGQERAEWFFDPRSLWPRPGTAPGRSKLISGQHRR